MPGTLLQRVVGVPTTTLARVAVRTSNTVSARLKVGTNMGVTTGVIFGSPATPDANGCAQLTVTGLAAGSQYYYRVEMTDSSATTNLDTGTVGSFRTSPTEAASFAFCLGSCSDTTNPAVFATMAARGDDLFLHLGDLYYNDGTGTGIANFRTRMDARISSANHQALMSTTPVVYIPSDHDGMTNNSTGGTDATAWANWNTAYRERFPTPALPSSGCYYTFTWGRVRFIVTDTRTFKSAPSATDNSSKTALGATQKQWLKDTVTATTEPVIFIVNADPWIGAAETGDDAWLGFTTERTEMANFYAASGKNIVMSGGDMHALAAEDGSSSPGGIAVFHAAPFYNTASQKGGPYDVGPYPSDSSLVQQYGRVVVTDSGTQIAFAYTGYSSDNTQRVTLTKTFTVPAPPSGRVRDRWTGTALVRQKRSRWTGTALVDQSSSGLLAPAGPPGEWSLAFYDDFEGTVLDPDRWRSNWYAEGGTMNDVGTYAANVAVAGSQLVLTLASSSSGALVHTDFPGGYILPGDGYAEARVMFPGNGTQLYNWPSWWVSTSDAEGWPAAGEHDIAEVLGGDLTVNYHWGTQASPRATRVYTAPAYLGDAFHVYGVHRQSTTADYYWDGVKVGTVATADSGNPQILIFNVGRTSDGPQMYGAASQVRVDWVRAWTPT